MLADRKGYFKGENLEPEINYQAAGRLNMDALIGGAVDVANVVETNVAYQALNQTSNLLVRSRIVSAADYAVITKAGAQIKTEADLKGKHLAYAQATGSESFVYWLLEKQGIKKSEIDLVPLQPAGLVDHFIGSSTEAVATWEPFVTTITTRIKDVGPVFRADTSGFTGIMLVATKKDWAHQNSRVLEAYDRAMERAAQFARDSTDAAQLIIAEQTGLPIENVKSAWSRFDLRYMPITTREKNLVVDVVRRIKAMQPEMKDRQTSDIDSFFP